MAGLLSTYIHRRFVVQYCDRLHIFFLKWPSKLRKQWCRRRAKWKNAIFTVHDESLQSKFWSFMKRGRGQNWNALLNDKFVLHSCMSKTINLFNYEGCWRTLGRLTGTNQPVSSELNTKPYPSMSKSTFKKSSRHVVKIIHVLEVQAFVETLWI